MSAVEFDAELSESGTLVIPLEAAARLPKAGRVRVIILTDDVDDAEWNQQTYQQFLRDDSADDEIYESLP
jgi:hypothetical protein